jgi:hypothetical protein
MALFFESTVINIGNSVNTPFWEARWLNGVSPKDLAPNLHQQARFKNRTVSRKLTNYIWIKNLRQVNSEYLLDEFFLLYTTLSEVHLNDVPDSIF